MQPENIDTPTVPITPEKAPKQTWKIIGIIAIALVIIMGGVIAFLLISQADDKDNDAADNPTDCIAQNDNDEASYEKTTYTSRTYGLKFDYPKEWTLKETPLTESDLNYNITTKVTTTLGTELTFVEKIDGIGGDCGEICENTVFVPKFSDTKIDGLVVVSGDGLNHGDIANMMTFYVSRGSGAMSVADAMFPWVLPATAENPDEDKHTFAFFTYGEPKSDEEQQQIIDTLSSIRRD